MKNITNYFRRHLPPGLTVGIGLTWVALVTGAILGLSLLSGCKTAPTAVENAIFDIRTNLVPVVITRTNYVPITNIVTTFVTNEFQQTVEVPVVHVVTETNVTTLTNTFESTSWVTRTNVADTIQKAGRIADVFAPGLGSLASAIALGLLGIWGTARQKNKQISSLGATAEVLTQTIEVGRQLFAKTPQGAQVAEAWTAWMIKNQTKQEVLEQVIDLLKTGVNKPEASMVADDLLRLMNEIQNRRPPSA